MKARDFCFWLQGYFELNGVGDMPAAKMEQVRAHLALVFQHEIDPSMGGKAHQDKLNETHSVLGPKGPNDIVMRC